MTWASEGKLESLLSEAEQSMPSLRSALTWGRSAGGGPPLRKHRLAATITHPGGGLGRSEVVAVVCTPECIFILHNGYVHATSAVRLAATTAAGVPIELTGHCVECAHVAGNTHLCEVRFESLQDLRLLSKSYRAPELPGVMQEVPASLKGRVLIIEDHPLNAQLFETHLRDTKLKIERFTSDAQGLERLRSAYFNLVICSAHLHPGDHQGVIARVRAQGHTGAILLLISDRKLVNPADQDRGKTEAALVRPFSELEFLSAVSALVSRTGDRMLPDEIVSNLADRAAFSSLLADYVDMAKAEGDAIREGVKSGDLTQVRAACAHLHETGAGFGYAILSQTAGEALVALDASMSVSECAAELDQLLDVASRLVAGTGTSAETVGLGRTGA